MRLLLSLLLMTSATQASHIISTITCPEYDETIAIQLEPEKSYFHDTEHYRNEILDASEADIKTFIAPFAMDERPVQLSLNETLASQLGAKVVYSMTTAQRQYDTNKIELVRQDIAAPVVYHTPHGYLAGDSRGEFGGELVFVDRAGQVNIIASMNLEDIYRFSFGYVVTEGLAHLSFDTGMLQLITFREGKPEIAPLYGLLGSPIASQMLMNGDLLIKSRTGEQVLRTDGSLIRVRCEE